METRGSLVGARVLRVLCFLNYLVLDIDAYAEKYGSKAVRKNITIPAWLNTFGEKKNLNFSKVLQDALMNAARSESI